MWENSLIKMVKDDREGKRKINVILGELEEERECEF